MNEPCTSAAPFSRWHTVHGQAVYEFKFPRWVPWWEAYLYGWVRWFPWTRDLSPPRGHFDCGVWSEWEAQKREFTERRSFNRRPFNLTAGGPP